jgi:transglutaminase-like putative cysteine protease
MPAKRLGIFFFILIVMFSCKQKEKNTSISSSSIDSLNQPASIPRVSIAEIETGIKAWIDQKTQQGDGYFHMKDGDKELNFKLVRVHTEYLSNLGPNRHFACVDLADEHGDVYDVDFFMEGPPDSMMVTENTLHKLNGKPFYTWKQKKDKTWFRVPVENATNDLLGIVEGKDAFEFYYEAQLPEIKKEARLWLPLASSDDYQTVHVLSIEAPVNYQTIRDEEYNNSILFFELKPEHSGKKIKIAYEVERLEKGAYVDKESDPNDFLGANILMPLGGQFRDIALEAIGDKRNDSKLMQARALYDYIIDNMRYMKYGNFGRGDAVYACDSRTGNCSEFHSFFISLARTVGIPARFAIGASIPSDRDEGGIDGYHCWAEFYAEGKWWPVDISEGNKYTALATYYFGRHPANRIELSRGRDLVVNPAPQSGPINMLAYPLLEIGGDPAFVKTTFTFLRKRKA